MILVPLKYPLRSDLKRSPGRAGSYLTLGHLKNCTYVPADLTSILAKFRRSDVIRWITAVSSWISAEDGMNIRQQMRMAEAVLPDDIQRRAAECINKEGDIFCLFHRGQLLLMLQFALLVCTEGAAATEDTELCTVMGECMLMTSDILGRIENDHKPDIGRTPEDVNRWVALVFASLITVKDRSEIIARAQAFWLEIPSSAIIAKRLAQMGIRSPTEVFQDKYGVSIRDVMLFIMCLYHHSEKHAASSATPLRFDLEALYVTAGKEIVEKILALFGTDPDSLAFKLLSEPRQNWSSDFQALRRRPLLRLSAEHIVCPDFSLLYRCLTDGIYYLLEEAYGRDVFRELFGHVFEQYVTTLIRQFAIESSVLVRNFYASPFFQGTNDEAGDGILHWEDSAALLESKARLLTSRQRYGGFSQDLMDGIDYILGKKDDGAGIAQLSRNLRRVLAGERVADGNKGLDLSRCRRFFPLLVVYDEALAIEAVRQYADAKFRSLLRKHQVEESKIGPLLILSLPDVEVLASLGNNPGAKRLITEYAAFVEKHPRDRLGNFRTFVHNHDYGNLVRYAESWIAKTHVRVLNEFAEDIRKRLDAEQAGEGNSQ